MPDVYVAVICGPTPTLDVVAQRVSTSSSIIILVWHNGWALALWRACKLGPQCIHLMIPHTYLEMHITHKQMYIRAVAETWRRVWGERNFFFADQDFRMRCFLEKTTFFSHRPGFPDFPFLFPDFSYLYYVKGCIWPFPHKKNTFFNSVHTFAHIRQHYFSKYWGDGCMGRPFHLKFWGESVYPSPPRSPPLHSCCYTYIRI